MKPHLITLPPIHADLWEEITKEFGFFRFRNGNQIGSFATEKDLEVVWDLMREKFNQIIAKKN